MNRNAIRLASALLAFAATAPALAADAHALARNHILGNRTAAVATIAAAGPQIAPDAHERARLMLAPPAPRWGERSDFVALAPEPQLDAHERARRSLTQAFEPAIAAAAAVSASVAH